MPENNNARKGALHSLLNFSLELDVLSNLISEFSWDSEELVTLNGNQLVNVIRRYLTSELSAKDVNRWANLIESREDIGYEPGSEELINKVIFDLANPEINGDLDAKRAEKLLRVLNA